MYAVLEDRGKQYIVKEGEIIEIDLCDLKEGDEIEFSNLLMVRDDDRVLLGDDVSSASVKAEVIGINKKRKITIIKYRRRKRYRRKAGHRQKTTSVLIKEINLQ
jgi:large subunit ribosomal protein L21